MGRGIFKGFPMSEPITGQSTGPRGMDKVMASGQLEIKRGVPTWVHSGRIMDVCSYHQIMLLQYILRHLPNSQQMDIHTSINTIHTNIIRKKQKWQLQCWLCLQTSCRDSYWLDMFARHYCHCQNSLQIVHILALWGKKALQIQKMNILQ